MSYSDRSTTLSLAFACLCNLTIIAPVQAQITPDNSLILGNESSTVKPNAIIRDQNADLIEGGAIRDRNLFHSFSEFNVGNGNAVYFASPDGIANILTRITGNNVSNIFGTLGVDGGANLFLNDGGIEGRSGNINLTANKIDLSEEGSISAQVNRGTEGNIVLTANSLFLD